MAFTPKDKALVQKVIDAMSITGATGDLEKDANAAIARFVSLINGNVAEADKIAFDGKYTPELGAKLLASADEMANGAKFAGLRAGVAFGAISDLDEEEAKKQGDNIPDALQKNPELLVELVEQRREIMAAFDTAHANGWGKTSLPSATVETKKLNALDSLEAQIMFGRYKEMLYTETSEDGQQTISAEMPDGKKTDGDFYARHFQNIDNMIRAAEEAISEMPNNEAVLNKEFSWYVLGSVPVRSKTIMPVPREFPGVTDKAALDAWYAEAKAYMEEFLSPQMQAKLSGKGIDPKRATFTQRESDPLPEQKQKFDAVTGALNLAFNIDKALLAGDVGPQAESIDQEAVQPFLDSIIIRPGKSYSLSGGVLGDIEAYKKLIGDTAAEGMFGSNFKNLHGVYANSMYQSALVDLKNLQPYLPKELWDKFKALPVAHHNVKTGELTVYSYGYLEKYVELSTEVETALSKAEETLTGTDAAAFANKRQLYRENIGKISGVLTIQNGGAIQVVDEQGVPHDIKIIPEAGLVSENKVQQENTATVLETPENRVLSDASKVIEQFLIDIAPTLKEQGMPIDPPSTADGTFDQKSQKALQVVLMAADAGGIADMGDEPWLYTADKGTKLAEGLKSEKFRSKLSDVNKAKLTDDAIEVLILSMNTLDDNKKLADKNLTGANSATELAMGPMGGILMWFIGILQSFWPQSVPFISDLMKNLTGGKVDLQKTLSNMSPDVMDKQTKFINDIFNTHGSKAESAFDRLVENYKTALTSKNEDGSPVTIDQIRNRVMTEIVPGLGGTAEQKKAYEEVALEAFQEAQKIKDNKDLAATTFASVLAKKQAEILKNDSVQSSTQASRYDTADWSAIRSRQKDEARKYYMARSAPLFFNEGNGRVSMVYFDAEAARGLEYYGNRITQHEKNTLDPMKQQIEAYKQLIDRYQKYSEKTDEYHESDIQKFKNYVEGYKADLELTEMRYKKAQNDERYLESKEKYLELSRQSTYVKVDITDEVTKLRRMKESGQMNGINLDREDFPGLSKLTDQHQFGFYKQWYGVQRMAASVDYYVDNSRIKSNPVQESLNEENWEKANDFLKRWEKMEHKEEKGKNMSEERQNLLLQYERQHTGNPYLKREEIRSEFQDNKSDVGNNAAAVKHDFYVMDPSNQFKR